MRHSILLIFLSSGLFAHDLYLLPRAFRLTPGQAGVVEFHNGETFPKSQVPPVLARVRSARMLWAKGKAPLTGLRLEGPAAVAGFTAPDAAAYLLTAETIPNFIELPAEKFQEYLQHENLAAVIEWRKQHQESGKAGRELYSKYVKSILHSGGPDRFVCQPAGQTIEFVPMADPGELRPGQRLTVQVLFRGAPAANFHVEATSLSSGVVKERLLGLTNREGKIDILLDVPGVWKLHGIQMERRSNTAEADWESFWASLTFEVTR